MKILIAGIGKTNEKYLDEGMSIFLKRLKHYTQLDTNWLPDVKKFGNSQDLMDKEADVFLNLIDKDDYLVVCDEHGKSISSVQLAGFFEEHQTNGTKRIVILIGGAFGFSDRIKSQANLTLSLSNLTFSHQMIRLFLLEQVYRAYTIIRNEKYHNE